MYEFTWKMTRAPSQKKPSMTYTAVWYGKTVKKIVKNQDNVWKIYKIINAKEMKLGSRGKSLLE